MPKGIPGSRLPERDCGNPECSVRFQPKEARFVYCSRNCYYTVKRIRGDRPPVHGSRTQLTCDGCGVAFDKASYIARSRRFHSRECYIEHMQRYAPAEPDRFRQDYATKFWRVMRGAVRQRDNETCQICFKPKQARRLTVHHKVPRSFFEDFPWRADHIDNLVTVCYSCHYRLHFGAPKREQVPPAATTTDAVA